MSVIHIHLHGVDTTPFDEGKHHRATNGQFGTGGGHPAGWATAAGGVVHGSGHATTEAPFKKSKAKANLHAQWAEVYRIELKNNPNNPHKAKLEAQLKFHQEQHAKHTAPNPPKQPKVKPEKTPKEPKVAKQAQARHRNRPGSHRAATGELRKIGREARRAYGQIAAEHEDDV